MKVNLAITTPLSGLSYAVNPAVYWKSVPIAANTATLTGAPDSFTVAPALPAGLVLNKATGSITGTPTAAAASAVYVITAKSSTSANVTANVTITVNGPPSGLVYASNPATYWKGVAIASNAATATGIVDSFTVSPALPAGLSLNKATGAITGTPSAAAAAAPYTVTAKNPAGTGTVSLSITVNGAPTLAYAPATALWYKSTAIAALTPATTGIVDSVTVSPALPAGLSLTAATGRISGTPTVLANGNYVFTAWNKAGIAKDTIGITVSLPGTPLAIQKDLALDSANTSAWNIGYTGASFLGTWPMGDYHDLMQFDLSGVTAAGLVSAKLVLKTYAYGEGWTGAPVTLKAHIFRIKHTWIEGTGNWYWHEDAWKNNGEVIMANYGLSNAVKAASTNPTFASGATHLDKYLIRPDSLIAVGTQNVVMTYPAASIHHDFNTPTPGPANLVDMELDLTTYVAAMAGNSADCGFVIYIENLPSAGDFVGVINKEAGDGSYGAKLYLNY